MNDEPAVIQDQLLVVLHVIARHGSMAHWCQCHAVLRDLTFLLEQRLKSFKIIICHGNRYNPVNGW